MLVYALVPSILYYIGILMAIEPTHAAATYGLDLETPAC